MRSANNDPVKQWLIVYFYHIRMDTPEPQKQFGLWWACHSISRLKSLIQRDSNSKCRNNIVVFTKNNTKHWCKCFGKFSNQLWKQYPPKNLNHQHLHFTFPSQRNPIPQEVFPPQILLRGHGRLRPVHPWRPWPPGAAPPRRRGLRGLRSAAVSCLGSRGPEAEAAGQNSNGTKGRKNSEKNFGHRKSRKFWKIVATQNPPWT